MYRHIAVAGLIVAFLVACDSEPDSADDPQSADQPTAQEQFDRSDEESRRQEQQMPRTNETETPDDDQIGEMPDGVGIPAGESAPDVAAVDADGNEVQLLELAEDESILVFFYRGGWCPYCNFQIREMTEAAGQFEDRGVTPVAISVDRQEAAADTAAGYEIPFPVLSDPDLEVHQAFEVIYEAGSEEVEQLAEMGLDIEEASGRDHNSFAIPSVFLIDAEGTVQWAHANPDYQIRPSVEQLLAVIDESGQ